jgi:hypothetical protein
MNGDVEEGNLIQYKYIGGDLKNRSFSCTVKMSTVAVIVKHV